MAARRFFEVECLRGLAIALVVAHHVNGRLYDGLAPSLVALPWPMAALVLAGYTGVDLFFVLSGFLLSRPFLAEARGGRRVGRAAYAERRALRVLPLYVVAVVVASMMAAARPADLLAGVPYLFFLNAFPGGVRRLEPHSDPWWSLATGGVLGVISYSLYLVHYPVIYYGRRLVIRAWPGILPMQAGVFFWTREAFAAALLLVAAAVGLAALTYVAIERPMLRVKDRLPS